MGHRRHVERLENGVPLSDTDGCGARVDACGGDPR
jgi:hypothetical protein